MPVSPVADIALMLSNLETMVSESAVFQAAVGAGDAAAALPFIYWPMATPPVPPFAWLQLEAGRTSVREHTGGAGFWRQTTIKLVLELPVNQAVQKDREIEFWNFAGGVIGDLETASGADGKLEITAITLSEFFASDPDELTDETDKQRDTAIFEVQIF